MAVPKQKTGRARTHSRRSANDVCAMPSRYYKGREVVETE